MRYFIIPLGIILYIWWSVISIKTLIKDGVNLKVDDQAIFWLIVTFIIIAVMSVIYW